MIINKKWIEIEENYCSYYLIAVMWYINVMDRDVCFHEFNEHITSDDVLHIPNCSVHYLAINVH